MVGGTLIDVMPTTCEGIPVVRLWAVQKLDELAVHVEPSDELPAVGDEIWWQDHTVFWTPADKRFRDRPLRKIGYSFDPGECDDA